jgi:hypothetical protein
MVESESQMGPSGARGMGVGKIKIDKILYEKLKARAEALAYSGVDEFIQHVLEREVEPSCGDADEADAELVRRRLIGLGYIA